MQRAINHILLGLLFAKAYIDDIFVASVDHDERLKHLRSLFSYLRTAELKVNYAKCSFGQKQADYLGYLVFKDGVQPPPAKVEAIQQFPKQTTATELRRFIGVINYYRQCIPRAAELQASLHNALKGLT